MTDKDKFLADKVKALKGKYSKYQANQLALNMYEKAQQGGWYKENPPLPQNIGYQMPNLTSLPKQDFQMDYKRFDPQPLESNNPFADQVYNVPQDLGYTPKSFAENTQNVQPETEKKYYDTNRVNITPPPMFGDPTYNLSQGMYNFGRGNTLGGIAGVGAGILGTVRNSLSGFAAGKEDRRVAQEYGDKIYDDNRRYNFAQQGGKLTNADLIAQNAVTDQEQGNVNVEGGEFIMRNNGQIQPVVGEPHVKNGKIADGVDTTLEGGDKVLSNYNKLKPADVKELKERYNLSLKSGTTFAEAQKKLDSKLGIKKLEAEKADILIKMETASKIKDENSKQLSLQALEKQTANVNEKISALSEIREGNFNFLFERQEKQPKKGDGSQLFDKDGKEVFQQGGKFAPNQLTADTEKVAQVLNSEVDDSTTPITMRKIKNIQGGVTNDRFGDGYYIYYDKEPVDEGFDVNRHREFVTKEAFQNTVVRTPAYQDFKHLKPQENLLASFQQGGEYELSPERMQELMTLQQGGEKEYYQVGGRKAIEDYLAQWKDTPDYGYPDVPKIAERFKPFFDKYGVAYDDSNLSSIEGLDALAGSLQANISTKYPELAEDYGMNIAPTRDGLQWLLDNKKISKDLVESIGIKDGKINSGSYGGLTESERAELQKVINSLPEADRKVYSKKNYLDSKAYFRTLDAQEIPFESKEEYDKWIDENKDKKVGDYYRTSKTGAYVKPLFQETPNATSSPQTTTPVSSPNNSAQQEIVARDNVKNIQANFPTFIPTYSPMQSIAKEEISIPRLDPIKMTPEPMLAEQERQRQVDVERVEQTGMSPQQQEAILAQGLASSQMASNDAISKVETWNAQNQFATDQYNVGAQTKEDIMNAQFRQDFQGKALQTLANQEADIENKRKSAFLQNQSDRKYVDQINMTNALSDQFALVPGQGIVTLNNKPFQMENDYRGLQKWMTNATPEQIFEFKKLTGQADATSTSTNPDLVSNIYGNKAATVKKKTKK